MNIKTFLTFLSLIGSTLAKSCIHYEKILLCNDEETCPQNYHICNEADKGIILGSMDKFKNITKEYVTDIGSNDNNNCVSCNDDKYSILYTIQGGVYKEDYFQDKRYCLFNSEPVQYGMSKKINDCLVCKCDEKKSKCINICEYSNLFLDIHNFTNRDVMSCMGLQYNNKFKKYICSEKDKLKNIACCINNNCNLLNCDSCLNYGDKEICYKCKENYYYNDGDKGRCFSVEDIKKVCSNNYKIDEMTKSFTCLKCIHGNYNDTLESCICKEGWYGEECEINYNRIYCNENGIYNIQTRQCRCYDGFSGVNCDTHNKIHCNNGTYSKTHNKCICHLNYRGDYCNEKIHCKYGYIMNDNCICNHGFYGKMCNIPGLIDETTVKKNSIITLESSKKQCVNGILINNTCQCFTQYNGNNCLNRICKNGIYNSILKQCNCFDGWYGDRCELNCNEKCSYNGDICGTFIHCDCFHGWIGNKCEKHILTNSNIKLANSIILDINTSITQPNYFIKFIDIRFVEQIPIKIERNINYKNRIARNLEKENNFISINISIFKRENYTLYMYPNNNKNIAYPITNDIAHIKLHNDIHEIYMYNILDKINTVYSNIYNASILVNSTINNTTLDNNTIVKKELPYTLFMYIGYGVCGVIFLLIVTTIIYKYQILNKKKNKCNKESNKNVNLHMDNPYSKEFFYNLTYTKNKLAYHKNNLSSI